jgi:rhodanese-related sulfurtransferase
VKSVLQVFLMLSCAAILACVHGFVVGTEGSSYESVRTALSVDQALELAGAIWIDARSEDAYALGHYPEALNINEDNWMEGVTLLLEQWDPGESVVVYCDDSGCAASRHLSDRIRSELGLEPVYWLQGGWEALESGKGLPE